MASEFIMAKAEKDVRVQILQGLQRRAGGGQRVPSSAFQEVIGELGLRLGDAAVDRVLAVLELEPTSGLVSIVSAPWEAWWWRWSRRLHCAGI
jgi:hypothetical protein